MIDMKEQLREERAVRAQTRHFLVGWDDVGLVTETLQTALVV